MTVTLSNAGRPLKTRQNVTVTITSRAEQRLLVTSCGRAFVYWWTSRYQPAEDRFTVSFHKAGCGEVREVEIGEGGRAVSCTCPDCEVKGYRCKHMQASEFLNADLF